MMRENYTVGRGYQLNPGRSPRIKFQLTNVSGALVGDFVPIYVGSRQLHEDFQTSEFDRELPL